MTDFVEVPLFLPGVAASMLVAFAVARRVAARVGTSAAHGWLLVVSVGMILSATLSPQWAALVEGARGPAVCDFSRFWLASLHEYLRPGDTGGNVLMFVPLGVALAFVPRARGRVRLIVAAAVLPVAIETTQLMLGFLDRACQSADVVDNLLGLVIGLAAGAMLAAGSALTRRALS